MASKQNELERAPPQPRRVGALHAMAAVSVDGPEAGAFLQRQCMSDLRLLDVDGRAQWSGLLSAKGRLLFLFRIVRASAESFLLLAPGAEADALAQELRRFVLRSKVRVEILPSPLGGALGQTAPEAGSWLDWDTDRWVCLEAPAEHDATALDDAWQHLDTVRGLPRIDTALRDRFTPQMLSLQRLQAFSLSKGCYPGQEIVARTHYLGQQKRALHGVSAAAPLQVGERLHAGDRAVGEIIQVSATAPGEALAVVSEDAANGSLQRADGVALQIHPAARQG